MTGEAATTTAGLPSLTAGGGITTAGTPVITSTVGTAVTMSSAELAEATTTAGAPGVVMNTTLACAQVPPTHTCLTPPLQWVPAGHTQTMPSPNPRPRSHINSPSSHLSQPLAPTLSRCTRPRYPFRSHPLASPLPALYPHIHRLRSSNIGRGHQRAPTFTVRRARRLTTILTPSKGEIHSVKMHLRWPLCPLVALGVLGLQTEI